MASLDQFLADLDDLNDDEEQIEAGDELEEDDDDDDDDLDMMADDDDVVGRRRDTTGLLSSERMSTLMEQIEECMAEALAGDGALNFEGDRADEDDNEVDNKVYNLIVQCNEMVIDIENEIESISKTIRDEYAKRFPELESLILNPLDYARVVLKLGNETDLTQVDLTGILPSATIMVVTVTASTTVGEQIRLRAQSEATSQDLRRCLALFLFQLRCIANTSPASPSYAISTSLTASP
eukprot:6210457-Pleurochrysis_carterae.AAC.1